MTAFLKNNLWAVKLLTSVVAVLLLMVTAQRLAVKAYWETHPQEEREAAAGEIWQETLISKMRGIQERKFKEAQERQKQAALKERQEKEEREGWDSFFGVKDPRPKTGLFSSLPDGPAKADSLEKVFEPLPQKSN